MTDNQLRALKPGDKVCKSWNRNGVCFVDRVAIVYNKYSRRTYPVVYLVDSRWYYDSHHIEHIQ